MTYNLDGYVDVAARLAAFFDRFPDGSVQMDAPSFTTVDGRQVIWAQARAYRNPEDPRPGVGTAWEVVPGATPYTRGSELMVLETSAWGRAIAAVMPIGDKIATTDEVKAAESRRSPVEDTTKAMGSYHTPSGKTINRGDQPITEPQLKKLRYELKRLAIDEVMLNDFTVDALGFEIPQAGLSHLTKAQASTVIDAITENKTYTFGPPKVSITRTTTPDPDDPWSK